MAKQDFYDVLGVAQILAERLDHGADLRVLLGQGTETALIADDPGVRKQAAHFCQAVA